MAIGLAGPAAALAVSCTGQGTFTAATSQSCTIDQHLTGIHVVLIGGHGGTGANFVGGHTARVTADLAVNANDLYYVNVGGNGGNDGTAGANGGGAGGTGASFNGAGGGGASDLRGSTDTLASRLLVAGGGGGGGTGTSSGVGANADGASGSFGCLFICGTSASGSTPGSGEGVDGSTVFCHGGNGGGTNDGTGGSGFRFGAGGGGGYAGGGGGGEVFSSTACSDNNGGSGGGGSSFVTASATNSTITTDTTNASTPSITITAPVPTTSGKPGISGSPAQGQTLTETHAPWAHGPTAYTYQWERCDTSGNACLAVGNGGSTYNLTFDDVGHTIEVQETASNFYGSSLANGISGTATSAPTPVIGAPPAPTGSPTITGSAVVGQTLTEVNATWSNPPLTGRSYQWRRCDAMGLNCQPIGGATAQTYAATAADAGSTLDVQEFATNAYGQGGPATSPPTSAVGAPPVASAAPTIAGSAVQDEVLTEAHGTWANPPITSFLYQWLRCAADGSSCVAIGGATNQTYVVTVADVGATIKVQETASNSFGAGSPATSAPTAVVQAAAPPQVSIVGSSSVLFGKSVTFSASVTDSKGTPQTYRWTIAGTVVGTSVKLTHTFSSLGKVVIQLQIVDTAGDAFSASLTVTVNPQNLGVSLPWSTKSFSAPSYTVFTALTAQSVPVGARVVMGCTGKGCRFHSRSETIKPKKHSKSTRLNVSLLPLLGGAHLGVGARLTVEFQMRFWITTIYTFTIRADGPHRTVGCQAPGAKHATAC
jgi:hypothetical protein